ncbi:MAG TPA: hypothetical protein PLE12_09935 [Propionicimonas sp.]|nr:hypothetical protein [Actinotalea sp.]HRA76542.1 hypothetical protein [Propionicimonas sp.]
MSTIGRAPVRRRRLPLDRLTTAWMLAALVTSALVLAARGVLPQPLWTSVHVVTLGVLTSAVLQWSWYFARALLHLPATDSRSGRDAATRMVAFQVTLVVLVAAMWSGNVAGTVLGAGAIGAVIAWHGLALARAARTRLGNRFAAVVRYYVAAAGFLVVGCTLAGLLTVAMFATGAPAWLLDARDGLTLAHSVVNVGGWLGLSILGTLVTLGPTMLRTRIDPAALDHALAALPVLVTGLGLAATSAVVGWLPGVGIGLLAFAGAALLGVGLPLGRAARASGPSSFATWTVLAGLCWALVALTAVAVNTFVVADAAALRGANLPWVALLGAGGVLQVLVGALSYLMPVVIGGGPGPLRVGMTVLATAWPLRVALRTTALALLAAGTAAGAGSRAVWWCLVLVAYGVDVTLFAVAGVRQARARRAPGAAPPPPTPLTLSPTPRSVP